MKQDIIFLGIHGGCNTGATLVKNGSIVARFSGRIKWGRRVQSNRSILADSGNLWLIRTMNFAIKLRDFLMPFAASILNERNLIILSMQRKPLT